LIGNLLTKAGLALLRKSAGFGFTAQSAEEIRKFFSIHPQIARAVGYAEPSWSGKSINEHVALTISTWWTCVSQISKACAILPLHLFQNTETGKRVASEHPLNWRLYREPNPNMSALVMRRDMTAHVLTWGNAYARKVRRGGTGQTIGLWPWTPDQVRDDKDRAGNRVFIAPGEDGREKTFEQSEVFHLPGLGFDGLRGYSVATMARQSLGLTAVQDEYLAKFYASGGRSPYVLERKARFANDEQYKEFRARWEDAYGGAGNFHKAPILEGDITYKELGMPLKDAELMLSRAWGVSDICRWFDMTPHMAGDLSHATFSNVEHLGLDFVKRTAMYWLCLWEQEIDRQLLTEGEKGRYYAKHNVAALERGDLKTRFEAYGIGLEKGFMYADQVADLEDWNPIPNGAGKALHIPLNWQTLPGTGEPTAAERAALAKFAKKPNGGNDAAKN
jgi:HK97 family phage portal protein